MLVPIPVHKEDVINVLKDVISKIEDKDSFGGSLSYDSLSGPPCSGCGGSGVGQIVAGGEEPCSRCDGMGDEALPEGMDFWLTANYRIGNSMGQGGMRIFGTVK